jgi:hypothetical protein
VHLVCGLHRDVLRPLAEAVALSALLQPRL